MYRLLGTSGHASCWNLHTTPLTPCLCDAYSGTKWIAWADLHIFSLDYTLSSTCTGSVNISVPTRIHSLGGKRQIKALDELNVDRFSVRSEELPGAFRVWRRHVGVIRGPNDHRLETFSAQLYTAGASSRFSGETHFKLLETIKIARNELKIPVWH